MKKYDKAYLAFGKAIKLKNVLGASVRKVFHENNALKIGIFCEKTLFSSRVWKKHNFRLEGSKNAIFWFEDLKKRDFLALKPRKMRFSGPMAK